MVLGLKLHSRDFTPINRMPLPLKFFYDTCLLSFENPEALFKIGGNRFKEARDSGTAAVGKANHGGRGKLNAKSLERSTVDLALEFVNLIQNQRGFQANAKTITTTDELLGEVINLKR